MKMRFLGIAMGAFAFFATMQADQCNGWQIIEETGDYIIVQNYESDRCVQTIQIANTGDVYFLIAGPYGGFDQFILNGILPRRFPHGYIGKRCWLRRTKDGTRLVMSFKLEEPPNILTTH